MKKYIGLGVGCCLLIAGLVYAQEGTYWGFKESVNMSGPGAQHKCAARLHVCFGQGYASADLINVNTMSLCNNACDNVNVTTGGPNPQVICDQNICDDRCYEALATNCIGCDGSCL